MGSLRNFVRLTFGVLRAGSAAAAVLHALHAFLAYFGPTLTLSRDTVESLARVARGAGFDLYQGPVVRSVFGGTVDFDAILNAFVFVVAYFVFDAVEERALVKLAGVARAGARRSPGDAPRGSGDGEGTEAGSSPS